jgi:hypothetical protein
MRLLIKWTHPQRISGDRPRTSEIAAAGPQHRKRSIVYRAAIACSRGDVFALQFIATAEA